MKGIRILAPVLALTILTVGLALAQGTNVIDWSTIGSGGGSTSTDGEVTLNGALGQPVIGPATADSYRLGAGYWYVAVSSVGQARSWREYFLPLLLRKF